MRSKRWLWVLSLWALMLGIGVAQPPLLVLTNGDANGDNLVDDTDLLAVTFRMGDSCPQGCPEDLNGDLTVDDSDLLTVNFHLGAQGAPAFAGQVSAPQGAFRVALRLQLGDWVGAAQSVKVQLKPVGTEGDASVPIYEWTFSVGGSEAEVELDNLPAGVYTVRAFPAASGRWLVTELSDALSVPGGGGVPALHVPAPAWAEEVIPADTVPAVGLGGGPSRAHHVNLASGVYEHLPEPDLVVSNPSGPEVSFARHYSTHLAREGYASPGLPRGWTHSYDLRLEGDLNGLTLRYPNGAIEPLTPQQVNGQWLLNPPVGAPCSGLEPALLVYNLNCYPKNDVYKSPVLGVAAVFMGCRGGCYAYQRN